MTAIVLSAQFPDTVRMGATLPVVLRVTNTASDAVRFVYAGLPHEIYYDVRVSRPDGTEVWSRLHRRTLLLSLSSRDLSPGEVIELAAEWDLRDNAGRRVQAGSYVVEAAVLAAPRDFHTEPRTLTIVSVLLRAEGSS